MATGPTATASSVALELRVDVDLDVARSAFETAQACSGLASGLLEALGVEPGHAPAINSSGFVWPSLCSDERVAG